MPITHQVTIQFPHPLVVEKAPSKEEEFVPFDDGPVMETYNMTYDELHKNIVKSKKKRFPDDLASPTLIKERVIVTNTRRNQSTISTTNLAFIGNIKLSLKYLMAENKQFAKNL